MVLKVEIGRGTESPEPPEGPILVPERDIGLREPDRRMQRRRRIARGQRVGPLQQPARRRRRARPCGREGLARKGGDDLDVRAEPFGGLEGRAGPGELAPLDLGKPG
jgi:hypothetical protein